MDTRIKAVATASMYDMTVASRLGMDKETIQATKEKLSKQRWIDAQNGYPEYIPYFPDKPLEKVPEDLTEPTAEWFRFYALKRGHHIHALGGFTTTSNLVFMNYHYLIILMKFLLVQYYLLLAIELILNFSVKKHLIKLLSLKNYML